MNWREWFSSGIRHSFFQGASSVYSIHRFSRSLFWNSKLFFYTALAVAHLRFRGKRCSLLLPLALQTLSILPVYSTCTTQLTIVCNYYLSCSQLIAIYLSWKLDSVFHGITSFCYSCYSQDGLGKARQQLVLGHQRLIQVSETLVCSQEAHTAPSMADSKRYFLHICN